ncbi:MAG: hypothetical protein WAL92_14760 [Thiogranum sp.]
MQLDNLPSILEANESLVDRHLTAENEHQMSETLATLHPECVFEDLPLGLSYQGRSGAAGTCGRVPSVSNGLVGDAVAVNRRIVFQPFRFRSKGEDALKRAPLAYR